MENQNNTYKIYDNTDLGEVDINVDVFAVIAALAAMEVDGVVKMSGDITSEIISKLGMKKLSKGVKVDVANDEVVVDLSIVLKMNSNILAISEKVQEKVKATIENMTGMQVMRVNVNVANLVA